MAQRRTIAIIGATGTAGGAIARWLAKSEYRLLLISSECGELQRLVNELNEARPGREIEGMDCMFDASWEADMVVMAVPASDEAEVARRIGEVTRGKTVISISSRANDPARQDLGQLLPNSRVARLYHTGDLQQLSSAIDSFLN